MNNGRTFLRFSKPRTGRFTIYLLGDALPAADDDRVVFPLPYCASPNRVPDELLDEDAPDASTPANRGPSTPDSNTPAS